MAQLTRKFRIYPSVRQVKKLNEWMTLSCELYNAGLQERRDAWTLNKINVSYQDQNKQLTEIKEIRPELKDVNSHVLQDALRRLDKSYKSFFRRVKAGQKAGFPRFKASSRYHSFSVPNTRYKLEGKKKLDLSRFGKIHIKLDCEFEGKMTNLTITRQIDKWYASITYEFEPVPLPPSDKKIGIDLGYQYFAVLSDGTKIENPKFYAKLQSKLRVSARRVARRKKGSHRRRKAVVLLAKVHEKIKNSRGDFQHKLSRDLINRFGFLAVEDLNILGMTKDADAKYRNKALYDAAWGEFLHKLTYKAENAGRILEKLNPTIEKTASTCLCGARLVKNLSKPYIVCVSCGRTGDRREISSQVILEKSASRHGVQAIT